jgi:epoxyqueuosine reductase
VALGHSGTIEAVPVLIGYLQSRVAVLRAHAAWALGRLDASSAVPGLQQAVGAEVDEAVRDEMAAALGRIEGFGSPGTLIP